MLLEKSLRDIRVVLDPEEFPKDWYNLVPDLHRPLPPPMDPWDGPSKLELLPKIFMKEALRQEFTAQRFVQIPEELKELYVSVLGRPTPLCRARRLEQYLKTPAKIYFKREDLTPTGSHKPNTAIAQAFFAKKEGLDYLATETGAGQWGSALAFATSVVGLGCLVYMVRTSYMSKPYRRILMELYGAKVFPSPSDRTDFGKKLIAEYPDNPGSLGIAISEAIETTLNDVGKAAYAIGSTLNHVLLHQSIIGIEAMKQFKLIDTNPDIMIGCAGGGSNFAGFTFPAIGRQLEKGGNIRFIAVGASEVPKWTKGQYRYDFPDSGSLTPMLKMHTVGHEYIPPPIYSGGLRYHGYSPILSLLVKDGIVEGKEYTQEQAFQAAKTFALTEGIITAPETAHAIAAVIDEAVECKRRGERKVIAFNHSGHGHFDLQGYNDVLLNKSP